MSRGLMYIATGPKFVAEAERSVATFKAMMPDLPAILIKDADSALSKDAQFDMVRDLQNPSFTYIDKILPLKDSPFEHTIFLDTDTHCVALCEELFELLDRFDYAAAHAPVRTCWRGAHCPDSFPELNTGVIAFNTSEPFKELVDAWYTIYERHRQLADPPPHDQPAFREAAFNARARLYVLPPEYNLRSCFSSFIGGNAEVKILHDRAQSLTKALAFLQESGAMNRFPRTFVRERPAQPPLARETPARRQTP